MASDCGDLRRTVGPLSSRCLTSSFRFCCVPVQEKKKKYEPPAPPPRVGKKQRRRGAGTALGSKLPVITPTARCKLRMLKLERVKDWLLLEQEYVANQEALKPQEERNEEDRSKVDDLRGSPLSVGTLEELIDEK
jgi:26S proteasome regulatory subunit T2